MRSIKWRKNFDGLLEPFDGSATQLDKLNGSINMYRLLQNNTSIVPLGALHTVNAIVPMKVSVLEQLLRSVHTTNGNLPYQNASIRIIKIDPQQLQVGQRYVFREKYQNLIESLPLIFSDFAMNTEGIGNLGAYFAQGNTRAGEEVLGCYLPPIIERHGSDLIILDGVHRCFLSRQVGTTPLAVLIDGVSCPFPSITKDWSQLQILPLAERPAVIAERYFSLAPEHFRDVKRLGIDG